MERKPIAAAERDSSGVETDGYFCDCDNAGHLIVEHRYL
jgi:hypothetical protein